MASVDVRDEAGVREPGDESVEPCEDGMSFVLRSGTSTTRVGDDPKRPMLLEVNQLWGETLMDTQHFAQRTTGRDVTIGSGVSHRWSLLGIDMGRVPGSMRTILPWAPPVWSEVTTDWRADFFADDGSLPDGTDHTLFAHDPGTEAYTARVRADWDGFVDIEDRRYTLGELVDAGHARREGDLIAIPMDPGIRLMVDVDGMVFFAHLVPASARVADAHSQRVDMPFLSVFSVVAAVGLAFAVLMLFAAPPASADVVEVPDHFVELVMHIPPPPREEVTKKPEEPLEGAKAKKEEGEKGEKRKDKKKDREKGNKVDVKRKELDREVAEQAGILGAMNDQGLDSMFASTGLDSTLQAGIGGLLGAKGVGIGRGGLGTRGSGLGGGGHAEGIGGLGTKGPGSGDRGFGREGADFGRKSVGDPGTAGDDPIIVGGLDRALIDGVIKRYMSQIRYCYQRELTRMPTLQGKVVVKFTIARDGTVSAASPKTSTLHHKPVESCVVERFMRMQFPEPNGGGIVIVSYPFMFSPQ